MSSHVLRAFARVVASVMLLFSLAAFDAASLAQASSESAELRIRLVDAATRAPLSGSVDLVRLSDGTVVRRASDPHSMFTFLLDTADGPVIALARAPGHSALRSDPITGGRRDIELALEPQSGTGIATIGRVSVARGSPDRTRSATVLTRDDLLATGTERVDRELDAIPGVSIAPSISSGPNGTSSIEIRGARNSQFGTSAGQEILVLEDGEPLPTSNEFSVNLAQFSPLLFGRIEVVKGLGGTSTFGAPTIGGALNFVTPEIPTTPSATYRAGVGTYGSQTAGLVGGGTFGKFGFLAGFEKTTTNGAPPHSTNYSVIYDDFPSQGPFVTGLVNDTNITASLVKLRFRFSDATSFGYTHQELASRIDQSGLFAQPVLDTNGNQTIDPVTRLASYTGYPFTFGTAHDPKESADLRTHVLGGDLVLRAFRAQGTGDIEERNAPASICCYLQRDFTRDQGYSALWASSGERHVVTVQAGGYADTYFDAYNYGASNAFLSDLAPYRQNTIVLHTASVRDDWSIDPRTVLQSTLYASYAGTLGVHRYDPRVALVRRPSATTSFRISVGSGFALPRPEDVTTPLALGSANVMGSPLCPMTNLDCVAPSGNAGLRPESAVGLELGGTFAARDATFDIALYRTAVRDHIFSALVPAPAGIIQPGTGMPILYIAEPINVARAIFEGLEVQGRVPLARRLRLDATYALTHAVPEGIDDVTAASIGSIVNGGQFIGVPLHTGSLALTYDGKLGLGGDARARFVSGNNASNQPGYIIVDANLRYQLAHAARLVVAFDNIFNVRANFFSQVPGVPYPGFGGKSYPTTLYGLAPHSIMLFLDGTVGK